MLVNYGIAKNELVCFIETNAPETLVDEIVNDYKTSNEKTTIKGLIRYIKSIGWRIEELIVTDIDDIESIEKLLVI